MMKVEFKNKSLDLYYNWIECVLVTGEFNGDFNYIQDVFMSGEIELKNKKQLKILKDRGLIFQSNINDSDFM